MDTVETIVFKENSGDSEGTVRLKGSAQFLIKWEFESTAPVRLFIIKEVTNDYFNRLNWEYGIVFNKSKYYVSEGALRDSGDYFTETSETLLINFYTSGDLKYSVLYDPITFDLILIFYILFGILILYGIGYTINVISKKVSCEEDHNSTLRTENQTSKIKRYCSTCGSRIDFDANFCHECGKLVLTQI